MIELYLIGLAQERLLPTLEDTFNEAIQQLVEWGGVFMGEDEQ
jgi:hypothetical protein